MRQPRIGLALGSGSARGWAHIGVIRALEEEGIRPDIITGCSVGALVGAALASGTLDTLESWARGISFWDVVRLMDISLNGGLIEGGDLMSSIEDKIAQVDIQDLDTPFAAVATELETGREIWLQEGSLPSAVRASIALPGVFSPVRHDGHWLVDGGLTNPVPISLCRAMGADIIIAVNLNSDLVGRHIRSRQQREQLQSSAGGKRDLFKQWLKKFDSKILDGRVLDWVERRVNGDRSPGMLEVMAGSINIMQDRITKSRMAGDPPDYVISPRLGRLGLLEFDRAEEAISEGYDSARRLLPSLRHVVQERS